LAILAPIPRFRDAALGRDIRNMSWRTNQLQQRKAASMSADLIRIKIRNFPQPHLGRRLLIAGLK
jgi:hypothetical protein